VILDLELRSTEAILGAAVAGLGVAFVSRWSVRAHVAAGLVLVVPGLDLVIRRTFRWALPAGALTGAAARFKGFAEQCMQEYGLNGWRVPDLADPGEFSHHAKKY
jgi:DNA-binding transcriptional LysR family regulator